MDGAPNLVTRPQSATPLRADLQLIADVIPDGVRVLDVGCGDGALLAYLVHHKQVDGRGIEMRQARVNSAVRSGLSVIQGDADTDLRLYPKDSFDYVILSWTLQAVHDPKAVLLDLTRIGQRAIISFPNFGFWRIRLQLLLTGRMPTTHLLDDPWYATPNIHLCSISDFVDLTKQMELTIEQTVVLNGQGHRLKARVGDRRANLFGEQVMFVLSRSGASNG